jgi:hypothetical protein
MGRFPMKISDLHDDHFVAVAFFGTLDFSGDHDASAHSGALAGLLIFNDRTVQFDIEIGPSATISGLNEPFSQRREIQ